MKIQANSLCLALFLGLSTAATVAVFTVCVTRDRDNRSTREYIDDKSLILRNNPDYKFDEVSVITLNGTLQLSGLVNTADQKRKRATLPDRLQMSKTS
jgi:hypothetical protein